MKIRHCCTINHLYILSLLLPILISTSLINTVEAQPPPYDPSSPSLPVDDYGLDGNKISPSMALIVIVLVLGFFVTGCVSIYIQQCSNSNNSSSDIAGNGNVMKMNLRRGLDQSVIDTFPIFVYSDEVQELKIGKGNLECAVCLNEFEKDETLRLLPKCDHVFHPECIDVWLSGHTTCPVCRADLVPDPDHELSGKEETHPELDPGLISDGVEVTIVPELMTKGRLGVLRSHSTGHSLSGLGEDRERFTLRLPDEIRKQLVVVVAPPKLKRSASFVALPRVSSSRRGYRSGGGGEGSGSSRYVRFFGRSFRWTARNNGGDSGGDGDSRSKRFFGTVVTPVEGLPRLPV
ncbi:hypothetical protein SOVF_046820 [Spinacia oleracea]|uniref:RING-type E3 ubiquitin transferase n=1 Tax=Spinacia oleracea TaxID=3562 RepID=A0A9R0IMP2_SPIOL|nr:E3 ubiquitin-protein ligase ATL31-like [Spinacia oleracea]KNA21052.1 hypothetical protein SOVF_046820 [Spinacia oleracea]